ncbi:molybdopterin-dependent oxidoreductase [Scytonema sp. UIC 10036]|uniref:xanthine dehydrogenase family protein molybdopterin-binding subunit n=1 Tax=Scytonema sp. UIC 10036 TaxID=2304196 RepID=UPI0012DAA3F3|nr:xanthine dehydrogenase family protein molybdopterin-binding subunit [Scytonema sp. UIC 10036]MUG91231.1 molybdopterin-dependent oxidoreductase [Scytonema sp. UIC 10036]
MTTSYIGQPTSRVDGHAKVIGKAKYAAEFNVPNLTYGYVVSSQIAKGRITKIDASDALNLEGVLQVFTHENAPNTAWFDSSYKDETAPHGSPFRPLHEDKILYSGQPVALVVAETFELARYGATLVRVEYEREIHVTDLDAKREQAYKPTMRPGSEPPPKPRGYAEKAFANAAIQHEAEYASPVEHHNPMESFASTVVWEDDGKKITIYDKTQGAPNSYQYVCNVFGFSKNNVRVISPYVGGAFGSGLRPQYQLFLAVMAARELKRSVRVSLTRQQMFTFGHRPSTVQKLALGAAPNGTLEAVIHEAIAETSQFEDFTENVVNWSGLLYQCDNVKLDYKLTKLDLYTPIDMRAPGAVLGVYALECAMDELAYKVGIDPLELRLKNYAERDQNENKPFSSKELRECYRQGAEKFGWVKRNPEPRSMREGDNLIGWGMATGIWDAQQQKASAKAVLFPDGKLIVSSATADIGTGTYTIMTQIAAETLGLPIDDVTFKLGDSSLPEAPIEGGSWTASSVGSAVKVVCDEVRKKLFKLTQKMDNSPLANASIEDLCFADKQIKLNHDPTQAVSITEVMRHGEVNSIEEETTNQPNSSKQNQYTRNCHSAVFCEVKVDEELGTIRVTRVVSAIAGGRILNPKTARSQILGAVVWGIGMALEEESVIDQKFGRFMNHNLAEYHVPVNADIHDIDVIFVPENDSIVNPLGAKGLGEIGIVGVAAAIANAVFHATGKRIRNLPIMLDKLL